jgi:hypothetical protein
LLKPERFLNLSGLLNKSHRRWGQSDSSSKMVIRTIQHLGFLGWSALIFLGQTFLNFTRNGTWIFQKS